MKLDGYMDKLKKRAKKKSTSQQFQEVALEIGKEMNANPQEQSILFRFIKVKMRDGMWWKIKQVREYMELKEIKSTRYFMSCFKKDNK